MYKWKKRWFELIYPPCPNSSKFILPILSSWKINWIHPSPLTPGLAQTLVMGNVIARKHISPIRLYSLVRRDSHQHAIKFRTIASLTETTRYVFHWAQLDILMRMGSRLKWGDHTSNGFLPKWAMEVLVVSNVETNQHPAWCFIHIYSNYFVSIEVNRI